MAKRHYLRTHRRTWALTQDELGLLLGLTRSAISAYERHLNLPSFDTLLKLEIIFGTTPGYLYPSLYDAAEEAVMRAAVPLRVFLDDRTDAVSERKKKLLDTMMERAIAVRGE